ncbi:MAG: hypothetical protein OXF75_00025 [Acidimicrobiaceae bacterium]|nr:hypothetical protein [Acidimicrobiaceae bacterium]
MSIKEAIHKYRHEIRCTKHESPLQGIWARSHREFAVCWLTTLAGIAGVVIPVSVYQYSLLLQIMVPVAVVLLTAIPWFAWIVWGRDAYPLKRE